MLFANLFSMRRILFLKMEFSFMVDLRFSMCLFLLLAKVLGLAVEEHEVFSVEVID